MSVLRTVWGVAMTIALSAGYVAGAEWVLTNPTGAEDISNCNVSLVLPDAVSRDGKSRLSLTLELQIRDGKWQKDFLRGSGLCQGRHVGVVTGLKQDAGSTVLSVDVDVKSDLWVSGGAGVYEIRLKPLPDKSGFSGDYKGKYSRLSLPKPIAPRRKGVRKQEVRQVNVPPELLKMLKRKKPEPEPASRQVSVIDELEVSGKVTGRLIPPWPEPVKGHVPLEPGEHPRLIFRKKDVPVLRKRAETPEGKAIMERFRQVIDYTAHSPEPGQGPNSRFKVDSWPGIGFGFAYQMTGEQKYADRARDLIDAKFFKRRPIHGQDIHHGPQAMGLALTFDLCCDGWAAEFRQKCVDELWQRAQELITGTAGGGRMGGLNLAYWSNHNGIRVAGAGLAALAVLHEKTSDGMVLDKQAMAIANEAAYDQRGWLRDGLGGGAWCMEGMFYKGMTIVRGLGPHLVAHAVATGNRIDAGELGDFTAVGHFLEAAPGRLFTTHKSLFPGYAINQDNLEEVIWTTLLFTVPDDMMPGVKYLHTRNVGFQGKKTFGLERGCYAPYLMTFYPFDVEEKPPAESFRWISPDPVNGHWVFRPVWKDGNDVLLTWNMLTHARGSCHYERTGPPLEWRLEGFGHKWIEDRVQPVVKGKENAFIKQFGGARLLDWRQDGRTVFMTFDMTPAYMPIIERGQESVGLRKIREWDLLGERDDMGIAGTRHTVVDCSGVCGAPLLVVVVDELTDRASLDVEPRPASFTWRLPVDTGGASVTVDGSSFTVARGDAALSGVMLGGETINEKDLSMEVTGGRIAVAMALGKSKAPEISVSGSGPKAKVMVGRRTVLFDGQKLVLGERQ